MPLSSVEYRTESRLVCVALDPKTLHLATRIERIPEEIVKRSANTRETVVATASESFGAKITVIPAQIYLPAVLLCFGSFGVASQLFV